MISRTIWRERRNIYICSLCNRLPATRTPAAFTHALRWSSSSGDSGAPGPKSSGWGSSSTFVPRVPKRTTESDGLADHELAARHALLKSSPIKPQKPTEQKPRASPNQETNAQQNRKPGQHAQNRTPHKPNWGGPAARNSNRNGNGDGTQSTAGGQANQGWGANRPQRQHNRAWGTGDNQNSPQMASPRANQVQDFWSHFGDKQPGGKASGAGGKNEDDLPNWSRLPRRPRNNNNNNQMDGKQKSRDAGDSFLAQFGGSSKNTPGDSRQSNNWQQRGPRRNQGSTTPSWRADERESGNTGRTTNFRRAPRDDSTFGAGRANENQPARWNRSEQTQDNWSSGYTRARRNQSSNEKPQDIETSRPIETSAETSTPDQSGWGVRQAHSREDDRVAAKPKKAKGGWRSRGGYEEHEDGYDEDAEILAEQRRRQKVEEKAARKARRGGGGNGVEVNKAQMFIPEYIGVTDLASALKVTVPVFLQALEQLGFEEVTEDSIFTGETAGLVAQEFGFDVKVDDGATRDIKPQPVPEDWGSVPSRPPVVAIMGHVDHGKTTLLDWLRKSSIAAQEHGGITQHIGAFAVKLSSGKSITFLDTPGHAAFLSMRQRGAEVTDIVILVVAADDSVKPQTLEALKHVRDAKVPMIVAITKVDKEDARIAQVKSDLSNHGVELEEYGGDVQVVCVSGKTGQGMGDLEENILTLSEILDVRGDPESLAEGWVLEASVKPVGKVATVLIKRGTLRIGDYLVCGTAWAKVRVLRNEAGQEIEEAPPGTAVEVLGWRDELPNAGDQALQPPDEAKARQAVDYRREMQDRQKTSEQIAETERLRRETEAKAEIEAAAGEDAAETEAEPSMTTVNFIVRGDVVGSVEAVCATIQEIGNNEVRPKILRSAAGTITESDVEYATMSRSVIVNFNNPIPGHIKHQADEAGVKIVDRSVIYHLADDIKAELSAQLPDSVSQRVLGEAEILQVFPINVKGRVYKNIAGCKIRNGVVRKADTIRIYRKGKKVFDGKLESLKHGKKDVSEMRKGSECGMGCIDFQDLEVGDQIQAYEEVREKRTL
ncbi:hypothetical protein jhhlp_005711 [Lomentospora prolificans]|uniref:Translation initiation factor IF-2, mitochondrial n=1 Tax=Lomentospora prolificans TaxID=41688 RepID=A0A2N3N3X8_9PEZI|nr:hypothetical protein jhhlp_005711 [Lomentospora prolificans]